MRDTYANQLLVDHATLPTPDEVLARFRSFIFDGAVPDMDLTPRPITERAPEPAPAAEPAAEPEAPIQETAAVVMPAFENQSPLGSATAIEVPRFDEPPEPEPEPEPTKRKFSIIETEIDSEDSWLTNDGALDAQDVAVPTWAESAEPEPEPEPQEPPAPPVQLDSTIIVENIHDNTNASREDGTWDTRPVDAEPDDWPLHTRSTQPLSPGPNDEPVEEQAPPGGPESVDATPLPLQTMEEPTGMPPRHEALSFANDMLQDTQTAADHGFDPQRAPALRLSEDANIALDRKRHTLNKPPTRTLSLADIESARRLSDTNWAAANPPKEATTQSPAERPTMMEMSVPEILREAKLKRGRNMHSSPTLVTQRIDPQGSATVQNDGKGPRNPAVEDVIGDYDRASAAQARPAEAKSDKKPRKVSETAWFMAAVDPETMGDGVPKDFDEQAQLTDRYSYTMGDMPDEVRKDYSLNVGDEPSGDDDKKKKKKKARRRKKK